MRRETIAAGAIIFFFVACLHYDVIFFGKSLVQTNYTNPIDPRGLPQNYGERMVPHTEWATRNLSLYGNLRDPASSWWQWEPSTQFLKEAIAKREWPFWDPYVGAGAPSMANLLPAFFFPPYTVVVALGGSVGLRNAYFLFLLWAAGFFSYVFLRQHGLGFVAAVAGGAAVVLGGAMTQNLGAVAGQIASCLPLALVATRWLLDQPTTQRVAVCALFYGAISLASLPPLVLGVFTVVGIYAWTAIALGDCGAGRARAAAAWMVTAALSIGVVSFYYAPAAMLSRAVPHVAEIYRGAGLETMPVVNILQLLSPTLMGGVTVYVTAPYASSGYAAHIPYVGLVCVLLALLARPGTHARGRTLFAFSVVGIVLILLKLFGVPPLQWIGRLPILDGIHFAHYFGVLIGFLSAFLAALGIERLLDGSIGKRSLLLAAIVPSTGTASLFAIAVAEGAYSQLGAGYWIRDWVALATIDIAAVFLIALYAKRRERQSIGPIVAASLVALLAIENIYNDFHPKPAAWNMFAHTPPFLRLIRIDAPMGRLLSFGVPPANVNGAFRVFGLNSLMTFTPPRVYALYRHYGASPAHVFMTMPSKIPPEAVLDRAHVRFLSAFDVVPEHVRLIEARGYPKKFDDGLVALYERTSAPRFFFSSEYRVVPAAGALEAIATGAPREIVVEEPLSTPSTPNVPSDPDVIVDDYRFNSVRLTVDAPRAGLIYASESYFDGWTASVNGAPARILPANYAFRAVEVPAGKVTIEFRYRPPGLTSGLWITGASLIAVVVLLAAPLRRLRTLPATADPPPAPPIPEGT